MPYRAIKSNIADSLHVVVQIERRPGRRFIGAVLEVGGFDVETDKYDFNLIYDHRAHVLCPDSALHDAFRA
jgi:hypothetical protein